MSTLKRLRERIEWEGSPLSDTLTPAGPATDAFTELAIAGQRSAPAADSYALALESALEGYLTHFAEGRLLSCDDGDMRLLAGDYLYALGFLQLAEAGDTEAIEDLAGLIAICAALHSSAESPDLARLELAWGLMVLAITTGRWPGFDEARSRLVSGQLEGDRGPSGEVAKRAEATGLTLQFDAALIAFRGAVTARLRDT